MPDDLGALQAFADALPPRRCLLPATLTAMLSPQNYLNLLGGQVQLPAFSGPWAIPTALELQQLASELVGSIGQSDGDPAPVIAALTAASTDLPQLPAAMTQLLALSWPGRWKVLRTIGSLAAPASLTSGQRAAILPPAGVTVLDRLDPVTISGVAAAISDEAQAIIVAALIARGNSPRMTRDITHWWKLVKALGSLALGRQLEIFSRLGVAPDVAEGIIAWVDAARFEAAAASPQPQVRPADAMPEWEQKLEDLWNAIDVDADTWKATKSLPGWLSALRLGNAAHQIIAAYYVAAHTEAYGETKSYRMWTNSVPVVTIVRALEERFNEAFSDVIAVALALSRPDIFEFGNQHGQPPGWVYEIKPWNSADTARAEAAFYSAALMACNVPVIPGPAAYAGVPVPGTTSPPGQGVPCAGGWVVWCCAGPGAIAYRFRRPSEEALKVRAERPAESDVKDQLNQLIAGLTPSPQTEEIAKDVGILAILIYLLQQVIPVLEPAL